MMMMSEPQNLAYTDIKSIRRNAMDAISLCQKLIISYEKTESHENIDTANEIIKSSFKILAATEDAQEYAKLDEYAPQTFNLSQFLDDLVNTCRSVLRRTSIAISCDCEEGICINADPERLLACLLALITNSAQHVDNFMGEGEIRIKATRINDQVSISVMDNGYGMERSELDDLLDYSKNKGGLAVVKKFCDVVGTTFLTDTSPDDGFMASFRLPFVKGGAEFKSSQPIVPISTFSPYNIYLSQISDAVVQFSI